MAERLLNRINEYRTEQGLTQAELAGLVGVNALVKIPPNLERISETEQVEFLLCES